MSEYRRQRPVDLFKFEMILVYILSSRLDSKGIIRIYIFKGQNPKKRDKSQLPLENSHKNTYSVENLAQICGTIQYLLQNSKIIDLPYLFASKIYVSSSLIFWLLIKYKVKLMFQHWVQIQGLFHCRQCASRLNYTHSPESTFLRSD